jgi:hypothetical protein
LSTVEDVFQIIKKVSVEGHDVSESKVSTFIDEEVTVQEQDNFYEQAEASQSLYTKQIVNQENSSATSAENSAFLYNATKDYTEKVAKKIGELYEFGCSISSFKRKPR